MAIAGKQIIDHWATGQPQGETQQSNATPTQNNAPDVMADHWAQARENLGGKGTGKQAQVSNEGNAKGKGPGATTLTSNQTETKKYKTAICRFWREGRCNKGNNCSFAHGPEEQITLSTWQHTPMKGKGKPTPTTAANRRPIGSPGHSTGQFPWPTGLSAQPPPPQPNAAAAGGGGGEGGGGGGSERGLPSAYFVR